MAAPCQLAVKLDCLDGKLDVLIAAERQGRPESRPISKKKARKLRREQETEALLSYIASGLWLDIWSLFSPVIYFVLHVVRDLLLGLVLSCVLFDVGMMYLPNLESFLRERHEARELVRNMALALLSKLAAGNSTTVDPGL